MLLLSSEAKLKGSKLSYVVIKKPRPYLDVCGKRIRRLEDNQEPRNYSLAFNCIKVV